MNVLRTLILVTVVAIIGACGLLKEKNEGALASTYSSLYAFFDTATPGQIGCFPDSNNNNYSQVFTLRAMYSFQIERPKTLVVCIKNTTTYDSSNSNNNNTYQTQMTALGDHTISLFSSNSKINPGSIDTTDLFRIPVLGTLQRTLALGYSATACPFFPADNDPVTGTFLVGKFNMDSLTDYMYIVIMDDTCGTVVGTGQSPFTLAKQYGVTF
jgi:hypothetical protein